jgi:hypothetical protein
VASDSSIAWNSSSDPHLLADEDEDDDEDEENPASETLTEPFTGVIAFEGIEEMTSKDSKKRIEGMNLIHGLTWICGYTSIGRTNGTDDDLPFEASGCLPQVDTTGDD